MASTGTRFQSNRVCYHYQYGPECFPVWRQNTSLFLQMLRTGALKKSNSFLSMLHRSDVFVCQCFSSEVGVWVTDKSYASCMSTLICNVCFHCTFSHFVFIARPTYPPLPSEKAAVFSWLDTGLCCGLKKLCTVFLPQAKHLLSIAQKGLRTVLLWKWQVLQDCFWGRST